MRMNIQARQILSQKLSDACDKTTLTKIEIGKHLGLQSKEYIGMATSGNISNLERVPEMAWRAINRWDESGLTFQQYSNKNKTYVEYPAAKEKKEKAQKVRSVLENKKELADLAKRIRESQEDPDKKEPPIGILKTPIRTKLEPKIENIKYNPSPTTTLADVPLDRLKTIFDSINELKGMGYTVDIQISAK